MRIFVTGASGFVGSHVVERLSRSHEVLALARSERSKKLVERFGAKAVQGELGAVSVEALRGCDVVVHCAAFAAEWGRREEFWSANVEGTEQLLHAARSAGVKRFVHIGTEAAFFVGNDLLAIDEQIAYPKEQQYLYAETKAEAERRVLAANTTEFQTLSLRPRFVWGPRDESVLDAVCAMVRSGAFAWIDEGQARTSTTHVSNVAQAVELALSKGRGGEAYFLADNEEHTVRSFLSKYVATQGIELPSRSIPRWIARPAAALFEGVWKLFSLRGKPPLTRFAAAMLSSSVTVRTNKAREELGFVPEISFEQGLAELAQKENLQPVLRASSPEGVSRAVGNLFAVKR